MTAHVYTKSGEPMCRLPKITRHWQRLGPGATWTCHCGLQRRLMYVTAYDGTPVWGWDKIKETK